MSFTMLLLLAYIVMGVGSFIAFKRKHKAYWYSIAACNSAQCLDFWIHVDSFANVTIGSCELRIRGVENENNNYIY